MRWFRIFRSKEAALHTVQSGQMRKVLAGGREICLINRDGEFHAIQDICPHLGASLSDGTLTPYAEVTCPWHSYRFQLQTGTECANRSPAAEVFELKWEEGELLVGMED